MLVYAHWFNNHRIYGTLGYVTPAQYCFQIPKKLF
ncbi:IS3 family transposase [Paenibacillus yanchengensis]|uniref:IS3 family transposase n=1 Tax=Paenibacillus yanchengensis TaxID=2035833 RepID=A0ABW4YGM2_9BACL